MHRSHCIRETGHVCGLRLSSCMCVNGHRKPPLYCARGARWPRSPRSRSALAVSLSFATSRVRVRGSASRSRRGRLSGGVEISTKYFVLRALPRSFASPRGVRPSRRGGAGGRSSGAPLRSGVCRLGGGPLYFALLGVGVRNFRAANPRLKECWCPRDVRW